MDREEAMGIAAETRYLDKMRPIWKEEAEKKAAQQEQLTTPISPVAVSVEATISEASVSGQESEQ